MEYIKYTGSNGFQTYGFVKDNSNRMDMWKMRFGKFSSRRNLKIYSNYLSAYKIIGAGEYIYFDASKEYAYRLTVSKRHPIISLLKSRIYKFVNEYKNRKFTNEVEKFLEND